MFLKGIHASTKRRRAIISTLNFPNLAEVVRSEMNKSALGNYRQITRKSDGSPVTDVDLNVHKAISEWAKTNYPSHTFISEEQTNSSNGDPKGSYIFLDPIDGTENFVSGIPFWASGISIFTDGTHQYSAIVAPDLGLSIDSLRTFEGYPRFSSVIKGFSSSTVPSDLDSKVGEYRVLGSAMVNFLFAVEGRLAAFTNHVGAECWDILPGLNIALKAGMRVEVEGLPYEGQLLFPGRKYKFSIDRDH